MTFHLGENLRTYRLQKGLTQEQVADAFGVSPQAISRWENGSAYPDVTLLPGIAMYFDVSLDTLLGMDKLRDADAVNEIHRRVHALVSGLFNPLNSHFGLLVLSKCVVVTRHK